MKKILFIAVLFIFAACVQDEINENAKVVDSGSENDFQLYQDGNDRSINLDQFYEKQLDVPYTQTPTKDQVLDIIYPCNENITKPYKCIVLFHGGGWMFGDKRSETLKSIFQALGQGYAVVSVNVRLSGKKQWPAQLHDAKTAIRFLRAHAKKYQLDTDKIVVWGASSGGHIAQMLATTNGYTEFEDLKYGWKNYSSKVQGVVSWYGISDLTKLSGQGIEAATILMGFDVQLHPEQTFRANPINYVTTSVPRMLFVHGTADNVSPYIQSVEMFDKIQNITKDPSRAKLITFENAVHGDSVIKTTQNVLNNLDFVDDILWKGNNPFRTDNLIKIEVEE
ncbi:MAG: alpha/beta hydrolase [Flavobacteriia bacterium]|nr:alpha/beta hydrolase [Flavobacteriia bacterium]OJX38533.1 MAG: hypothetical protein BGO87_10475 [Flavobacteriia bacterium 40-80]